MSTRNNFYDIPEGKFPKNFKKGDRVRVYVGNGRGGMEGWTHVIEKLDEEHFTVDADELGLKWMAMFRGQEVGQRYIAHIDDMKSEAQGIEERHLYLEEEAMAGLL